MGHMATNFCICTASIENEMRAHNPQLAKTLLDDFRNTHMIPPNEEIPLRLANALRGIQTALYTECVCHHCVMD